SLMRSSRPSSPSVEVPPQLLALLGAVQLVEGLRLDLANPLAREVHQLADLLEGLRILPVEAEPQPEDPLLLLVELAQGLLDVAAQRLPEEDEVRRGDRFLLELVGEVELVLLVDHGGERDVLVGD